MVFIIGVVLAVAAVLVGIWDAKHKDRFWPAIVLGVLAMAAFVASFVYVTSPSDGRRGNPSPDTLQYEVPLVALGNDASTRGSFFLGSGYVDEELVYRYIVEGEFGAELRQVEAWRARVVEGDGEPRIAYWANCSLGWLVPWPACTKPLWVFHVPEGSIARDYAVAP